VLPYVDVDPHSISYRLGLAQMPFHSVPCAPQLAIEETLETPGFARIMEDKMTPREIPGLAQHVLETQGEEGPVGAAEHRAHVKQAEELKKGKRMVGNTTTTTIIIIITTTTTATISTTTTTTTNNNNNDNKKAKQAGKKTKKAEKAVKKTKKAEKAEKAEKAADAKPTAEDVSIASATSLAKIMMRGMDKSAKGDINVGTYKIFPKKERNCRILQLKLDGKVLCQVVESQFGAGLAMAAVVALRECHKLGYPKSQLELGKKFAVKTLRETGGLDVAL
jgi:hypothetical protein